MNDLRDLRQKGFRSAAVEYIEQALSLDSHLIRNPPATFFWRVRGDEVRILGLKHGDLLLVDRSLTPKHGDLAVVIVNRCFKIRRLRRWGDRLLPAPLQRSEKIDSSESVELWGVIRIVIRELSREISDEHGPR